MKISEALKAIIENPEDLSSLPGLVEAAAKMETDLETAETKIGQLHELNRKYLGMIPIKDDLEEDDDNDQDDDPTIEEAVEGILKNLKGE